MPGVSWHDVCPSGETQTDLHAGSPAELPQLVYLSKIASLEDV